MLKEGEEGACPPGQAVALRSFLFACEPRWVVVCGHDALTALWQMGVRGLHFACSQCSANPKAQ